MHRPPSASTHSNPAPHDQTTLRGIDTAPEPPHTDELRELLHGFALRSGQRSTGSLIDGIDRVRRSMDRTLGTEAYSGEEFLSGHRRVEMKDGPFTSRIGLPHSNLKE